jgi:hypothetical protein
MAKGSLSDDPVQDSSGRSTFPSPSPIYKQGVLSRYEEPSAGRSMPL